MPPRFLVFLSQSTASWSGQALQLKMKLREAFMVVSFVTLSFGCSGNLQPEAKWEPDATRQNLLAAGSVTLDGFSFKPPANFLQQPNSPSSYKVVWMGDLRPWMPKQGHQSSGYTWRDPSQQKYVEGTCPLYPGSTQMANCQTDNVPRELYFSVRDADFKGDQSELQEICEHDLKMISGPMETKHFQSKPFEFGTINGVRFCRAYWSADIPESRRIANAQMNVAVPAQGFTYSALVNGICVQFLGQAPKDDYAFQAIEQAPLTFKTGF